MFQVVKVQLKIEVPKEFKVLFDLDNDLRYIVLYGGRASGKSTSVALSLLILGMNKKLRILCTREVQNSIADSVHKLLADLISKYKLNTWEVQKDIVRNKQTGSEIFFKGLHNNSQSIKSIEGIDIVWVEEAQSVSADSINTLVPTIRKAGSRLIWTFNRLTENDPVWELIVKRADNRTFVQKINSDAIESLLSKEIIEEREKMRIDNPEMFDHVWLGEPMTAKTGSVFGKQFAQARSEGRITKVPYDASTGVYTAWDLGIGDSTVIWFFQVVGREIHFIDHYEGSNEDLGHYISYIQNKPYQYTTHFLPHDSKARELQTGMTRVEFFNNHGIYNIEVLRPTNFSLGQDDIDLVARPKFSLCWFDEEKCQRGLECLRAYHYEYDDKNKLLKNKPEHDWSSHSSSAFIYALMAKTEQLDVKLKVKFKSYTPKVFRKTKDNWG
ncbi:PBSX family phage terminase large subunit [TM7 phylum sp. oral taxon 351]|nr:PBSX family phage terminase large subunit [TM7 phylum sp. oral taxon 351]